MMVGGVFARQVVRGIAKNSDDVKVIGSLTTVAGRLDRVMVIPGGNIVLVMGVILALRLKWPIFGFLQGASQNWLLISNILLLGMMALVIAVFFPHNKKVDSLLQDALTEGRVTPDLRATLDDKTNGRAHHIEEILILTVTALMVLKSF
jgi:hypothetical protein